MKKAISGLCLEGTPVYHKRSKKGYCVLAGIPQIGGTFDLHLYRYDTEKKGEEVKSLYNITPEQFDLYGLPIRGIDLCKISNNKFFQAACPRKGSGPGRKE